jgi:hypothetical protein
MNYNAVNNIDVLETWVKKTNQEKTLKIKS